MNIFSFNRHWSVLLEREEVEGLESGQRGSVIVAESNLEDQQAALF